jgi:ABC-type lipoprotein release transport system permease subunit
MRRLRAKVAKLRALFGRGASDRDLAAELESHLAMAFSLATSPLLSPLLLEVPARDPAVIAAACGILATVAAIASWLPARRALAASPSSLLRRG